MLAAAAGLAVAVASLALCTGCSVGADSTAVEPGAGTAVGTATQGHATVVRVIDGDTVELEIGAATERVRLLGIDAPESVARNVPEQCFGAEAAAALAELLPAGTDVEVSRDLEARDHYGRLLLYLHRTADHLFVNEWLVAAGYAEAVSYEPNTTHRSALHRAQRHATGNGLGLWVSCDGPDQPLDPVPPAP